MDEGIFCRVVRDRSEPRTAIFVAQLCKEDVYRDFRRLGRLDNTLASSQIRPGTRKETRASMRFEKRCQKQEVTGEVCPQTTWLNTVTLSGGL